MTVLAVLSLGVLALLALGGVFVIWLAFGDAIKADDIKHLEVLAFREHPPARRIAPFVYIRPEGSELGLGFNFYPWNERRYSVGFILYFRSWWWRLRWAPHVHRFYCRIEKMQRSHG